MDGLERKAEPGSSDGAGRSDAERRAHAERWVDRFKAMLDLQDEGVTLVALDGRIRYANRAMRRLLGYETVLFDTIFDGFQKLFPDPEDMARAAAAWAEDIQRGEAANRTFHITRGDGAQRWLAFSLSSMPEEGFVLRARDVTREKEAADAQAELEAQLLQAQKMDAVGTLAGGVAHDMNNVLGVILGFASVLKQSDAGGASRAKCVDGILSAARRGRDLTSNLLGFARKGSFRKEAFDLNQAASEVQDILGRTAPKAVRIELELQESLCTIEADASQITHALMNLCLNAVEAMPEGGELRIQTRAVDLATEDYGSWVHVVPGRYVELVVQDSGAGMDPNTLSHAFDPFFTTKPKGRGTGLGLSMVYGTVRHHHGDIRLESAPGQGTRVTLLLPEAPPQTPAAEREVRSSDPALSIPARVLLVDDERLMLQAGKVLLESLGHQVALAEGGAEAVERFCARPEAFDVVILDMIMPEMDGPAVFERLQEARPNVRVLLASGYPRGHRVEQLITAGAAGFLRKPFEMDTLAAEINRLMGGPAQPSPEA